MNDRILVVDDSKQNRLVACGHLRTAGYQVTSVESGEQALERILVEAPDLVVLDILMPGLGGFETCRRIRSMPSVTELPVLFLTALGDREVTQPAIDVGADDVLSKPFNRAELLLRVRALIRQHRQRQQLAAQNAALRRISQMIVHDLRGPTTAIMANAHMLSEELTGELGEVAGDIVIAGRHLDRLIHDLLDLSTAEDVGVEASMRDVAVRELVQEVAAVMRGACRWREIRIVDDVHVDTLVGDPELLRRLLQNLVHNAIKFAPAHSEVTIEVVPDGDSVLLRVLDRGPGVPPEDVDRIFERYVSSGSHGLGLAFCKLAADLHGGAIRVERREPTGAVFTVQIPQITLGNVNRVKRPPSCS